MTVLYFAHARRATGLDTETIGVDSPLDTDTFWELITSLHPALAPLRASSRLARDNEFLSRDALIQPNDEIAVIPPVSGG